MDSYIWIIFFESNHGIYQVTMPELLYIRILYAMESAMRQDSYVHKITFHLTIDHRLNVLSAYIVFEIFISWSNRLELKK